MPRGCLVGLSDWLVLLAVFAFGLVRIAITLADAKER